MALVTTSRSLVAPHSDALVPYGSGTDVGEPLEQKLARLRSDREAHSRKQIWTKDPHGGPYRKVNANKGYDPLIQLPDGTERKADLGYERVKTGPTSNFVGNHMTQGAIDLVQAQLEAPATSAPPSLLLGSAAAAAAAAAEQQQPRLLHIGPASEGEGNAALPSPVPRALQQYSWVDAGSVVCVEVPLARMRLAAGGAAEASVSCQVAPSMLHLEVTVAAPTEQAATAGGTADDDHAAGAAAAAAAGARAAKHHLRLRPLHAHVVPARCACFAKGLPALPPCSHREGCDSGEPAGGAAGAAAAAAGSAEREQQAGQQHRAEHGQQAPGPQEGQDLHIQFSLPPGAEAVVVQLAKADPLQPWEALQGRPLALLAPMKIGRGSSSTQADLTALRKAVRQKLGRAPAEAPAPDTPAGPGGPHPDLAPAAPAASDPAAHAAEADAASTRAACQAALHRAEALSAAGQHAEALEHSAACLSVAAEPEGGMALLPPHLAVQLHALRARCHTQLGCLKQAAADYTAAIQVHQRHATEHHGQGQGQAEAGLCQLLLARSAVHEQQEQLEAALQDVEQAARVQQPPPAVVMLAVQRLRQACRRVQG